MTSLTRRMSGRGARGGGGGGGEFMPEPSVEGGQVFQTINPRSRAANHGGGGYAGSANGLPLADTSAGALGDDDAGKQETDPESHSISRGVRQARNAMVVVQESERGVHVASCQYPGKKDQDRFTVQLSGDVSTFPHFVGLFDGHGTSVFAADLCAGSLLSSVMEKHADPTTPMPTDESIVTAFTSLHDRVLEQVRRHPRTGTTAVALFIAKEAVERHAESVNMDYADPVIASQQKQQGGGSQTLNNGGAESPRPEGTSGTLTVKVAWVGDSRAIMISYPGEGETRAPFVTQLTEDHSLSTNQKEVDRITNADHTPRTGLMESPGWAIEEQMALERGVRARASSFIGRREINGREAGPLVVFAHSGGVSLQVSRSIGDALAARSVLPHPEIVTTHISATARTRFILASDGLWDVYTSEAAGRLVADVVDPATASRKLALAARSKRTQTGRAVDDISVIVLDINPKVMPGASKVSHGSTTLHTGGVGGGGGSGGGSGGRASPGDKCAVM